MQFEFATAGRILFGEGTHKKIPEIVSDLGQHVLFVTGANDERSEPLRTSMERKGMHVAVFQTPTEPTVDLARDGADLAKRTRAEVVVGFGGGSAMDAAKAIAALATNPGDVFDYLEVIGNGQPLLESPLPCLAVPTTAGTGTEVTRNAVLASPEHRVKVSLRHPLMLPDVAVVDPELTYALPPEITAYTGLDALTQLVEPFVTFAANPVTDALCREGLPRIAGAIRSAIDGDPKARSDMAIGSLFGGLALANAKLGAVHGFAGPLGGMYPGAPHGAICGRMLPVVMQMNARVIQSKDPDHPVLERFKELGKLLTGDERAGTEEGIQWVSDLCARLGVSGLRTLGVKESEFEVIVAAARNSSSMKGNPVKLGDKELLGILSESMGDA